MLVGLLGLTALSRESQDDTGAFSLPLWRKLPMSKDQAYFWMACLGVVIALVSSALDHMRTGFENPWLWIPTLSGIFGVAVSAMLALLDSPKRADLTIYFLAMGLLLAVGPLGFVLHVLHDLGRGWRDRLSNDSCAARPCWPRWSLQIWGCLVCLCYSVRVRRGEKTSEVTWTAYAGSTTAKSRTHRYHGG